MSFKVRACVLAIGFIWSSAASADVRPPNIVFILADDLGWSDLSCYGSPLHETPNLDDLAADGVRFTQAYAAASLCSPSRASILTGQSPARLHLTDFIAGRHHPHAKLLPPDWTKRLEPGQKTIAEALKDQGYATAMIGKWHLGGKESRPGVHGFDVNIGGTHLGYPPSYFSPYKNPNLKDGPEGELLPDRLSREAVKFIEEHEEKPFFVYLSYFSVHLPIQFLPEKFEKYKAKLKRLPPDEDAHRNPRYAAMVEAMDDGVGVVLAALKRLRLERNTIVVFFSDNGGLSTLEGPHTPATTNHPLRMGKGWLYEGGIRVPCIVRWPGVAPRGATCAAPVISDDFFPTFLSAAGIGRDGEATDGIDLTDLLKEPQSKRWDERPLHWHYPHYPRQGSRPAGAIRVGNYKLIEHFEDGRLELFSLETDPGESNDLSESKPELAARLQLQLREWRETVRAQMPTANPDFDAERPFRDAFWVPNPP